MAQPEFGHKVANRLRLHTTNGRRHQGLQPWHKERVGKLFLDLPNMSLVGAEWRGAQNGYIRTGRARWAICLRRFSGAQLGVRVGVRAPRAPLKRQRLKPYGCAWAAAFERLWAAPRMRIVNGL